MTTFTELFITSRSNSRLYFGDDVLFEEKTFVMEDVVTLTCTSWMNCSMFCDTLYSTSTNLCTY